MNKKVIIYQKWESSLLYDRNCDKNNRLSYKMNWIKILHFIIGGSNQRVIFFDLDRMLRTFGISCSFTVHTGDSFKGICERQGVRNEICHHHLTRLTRTGKSFRISGDAMGTLNVTEEWWLRITYVMRNNMSVLASYVLNCWSKRGTLLA